MSAYYNEFDPKAAAWLRELIAAGHIAPGDVDERSITDVRPHELTGYTQQHFFAGIGGWSYALRLAGWPDERPVRTGSCPCQPFSAAGQRKGEKDPRHLWPIFRDIITFGDSTVTFGEQVASKDGRLWLSRVRADLEGLGYAVGAADLCAAGIGAPHIRQRLYWVANPGHQQQGRTGHRKATAGRAFGDASGRSEIAEGLADSDLPGKHQRPPGGQQPLRERVRGGDEGMEHATTEGLQGEWSEYSPSGERCSGLAGFAMQAGVPEWNGPTVAALCSDGPRRVSSQPDAFPLAHGVPARMVKLRGSGNAIVPACAAAFILAAQEAIAP